MDVRKELDEVLDIELDDLSPEDLRSLYQHCERLYQEMEENEPEETETEEYYDYLNMLDMLTERMEEIEEMAEFVSEE